MWICDGNYTEQLCIKPYGFLVKIWLQEVSYNDPWKFVEDAFQISNVIRYGCNLCSVCWYFIIDILEKQLDYVS